MQYPLHSEQMEIQMVHYCLPIDELGQSQSQNQSHYHRLCQQLVLASRCQTLGQPHFVTEVSES